MLKIFAKTVEVLLFEAYRNLHYVSISPLSQLANSAGGETLTKSGDTNLQYLHQKKLKLSSFWQNKQKWRWWR